MDANGRYYITVDSVGNATYTVTVHQENGWVLGAFNAFDALSPVPIANSIYDQYRDHNNAVAGSTYHPGQSTESMLNSVSGTAQSIGQDEIVRVLAEAGKVTISDIDSKGFTAISGASAVKGYIDGTLSVQNEDILFDMVDSGVFDRYFSTQEDANMYALQLNNALLNGLDFIDSQNKYFNQNLLQSAYSSVPSLYDIATQIETIQNAGGSAAAVQSRIDSLVNRYALNMVNALKNYYMNAGIMEKVQIDKTYPGGYDAFIKDRMAYYTAVFRNSVNYKNQVRTYFNLLISCGN